MAPPPPLSIRDKRDLVARAQAALGMTHRQFGEALGLSERTALRWAAAHSDMGLSTLRRLAALVYPRDAALAAAIAESTGGTLESLGIVAPPPPPAPPPPVVIRPDPDLLTEAVVCAAADTMSVAPSAIRGVLLVAVRRARELGLTLEQAEGALAARVAKKG